MGRWKSATVKVARLSRGKGPHIKEETGTMRSREAGDADKKAEKPEANRKDSGGTAKDTAEVRQTADGTRRACRDRGGIASRESTRPRECLRGISARQGQWWSTGNRWD